ncbi:unnamed protein product [Urochloa decumbens]|uniref:Transposase n=1 Tax=Urochloa decumbens TaxID=240449 RepID=A0ABC8ZKY5_9POAL
MIPNNCPPWIDPGNVFRVVIKCEKYKANIDYGVVEMSEQVCDIWFDRCRVYSLDKFVDDMAREIIWVEARWAERVVHICVVVVDRDGHEAGTAGSNARVGSRGHGTPGVTDVDADAMGETSSSPNNVEPAYGEVDLTTQTIVPDAKTDGDMIALVNEDVVFEMGFKAADDKVEEEVAATYAIPVILAKLQEDMREAGLPIDDIDPEELVWDWDRDNLDMTVGIIYPCMHDFRQAMRQHAIVHEFELGTEKFDKNRF